MMSNCIFCSILNGELEASVIHEDEYCMVILDLYPMKKGHTLIISKDHQEFFADLDQSMQQHMVQLSNKITQAIKQSSLKAKGVNYLINDGAAATQHVPHVHLHIIPRQGNDFWKVIANFVLRFRYFLNKKRHRNHLDKLASELKSLMQNS